MLPLMDEIPYIFFLCTIFSIIKKHESETIFQFNTCFSKFFAFDPLSFVSFPDYPHDLPAHKWIKHIPLFVGWLGESIEDHLAKFLQVVRDFDVEREGLVMRMFVSTLKGEA
jgi:hypothetical protein